MTTRRWIRRASVAQAARRGAACADRGGGGGLFGVRRLVVPAPGFGGILSAGRVGEQDGAAVAFDRGLADTLDVLEAVVRVVVVLPRHDAALHRAYPAREVEGGRERLGGEVGLVEMREEALRVHEDGMRPDGEDDGDARLLEQAAEAA